MTPQKIAPPNIAIGLKMSLKIRPMTAGSFVTLIMITMIAIAMYASAMKGTTICVKCAIRLTPPKMMKPSMSTTAAPVAILVALVVPRNVVIVAPPPNASSAALPMLFDCTVGNSSPVAKMVEIANSHAYHRWPSAFSK